jgi:phage terminase small subunit
MNLTPKQEKFIQNIIQGMSQREAYKDAYKAKYKDEVIDVRACELFNSSKVQVRYKELMDQLEDDSIMSAKERMKWLSEVVKNEQKETVYYQVNGKSTPIERTADLNTKIKAIDTLNKMSGEYKTILDGSVEVKKKLEDLL